MTTPDPLAPPHATAEQMRDYFDWHVENGRGELRIALDRRGLGYLVPSRHERVGLCPPPPEETHGGDAVFVRVAF